MCCRRTQFLFDSLVMVLFCDCATVSGSRRARHHNNWRGRCGQRSIALTRPHHCHSCTAHNIQSPCGRVSVHRRLRQACRSSACVLPLLSSIAHCACAWVVQVSGRHCNRVVFGQVLSSGLPCTQRRVQRAEWCRDWCGWHRVLRERRLDC